MNNPYAKSANTYKAQQIQTASQEQILIMLFEGAIRFLNLAKEGQAEKNIEKFHTNITKCQRIITEFMSTLDVEVGGEMATNLMRLYEYLHYRLIQANLKKDLEIIDEVQGHLRDLRDTWEEAISISAQEKIAERANMGLDEKNVYSA